MPKFHFFEFSGNKICYRDVGEGKPVLFGHSYLWDLEMWEPVVKVLSKNYRCIVPDLFGHGDSDALENADLETHADAYYELMKSLGFESYSLCGLSIGAMWGAVLAEKYPLAIDNFLIMNSSLTPEPPEKIALYEQLLSVVQQTQCMPLPVIEQILPGFFGPNVSDEIKAKFKASLENMSTEKVDTVVSVGKAFINRGDLLGSISDFKGKLGVIAGEFDYYRSKEEAQQIAKAFGVELRTVSAGHISSVEQPEELATIISSFLG
ncbi:MAG: alpha/beta hydrolase [Lentisphaerales bacterium]|nr:alpha/beta hydrolase [Lentisphaerales bacterium]